MSTLSVALGSLTVFTLLAAAACADVRLRLSVLRRAPLGTLGRFTDPFLSLPGYRVVQVIPLGTSFVEERFTVSVPSPASLNFKAMAYLPPRPRSAPLARYFYFERAPLKPWTRVQMQEVAALLAELGENRDGGVLEARSGRLVYAWRRVLSAPQQESQVLAERGLARLARLVDVLTQESASTHP